MIHLIYFGIGILALAVGAILPFLIGLGICSADAAISGIKLPRFSYGSYWGTGIGFITLISVVYFVGALLYMGCGK
jgi:hypothetical protein